MFWRNVQTPTLSLDLQPGRRASWRAWAMLSPLLLWLILFVVAPTLILLVYSFCQRDEFGDIEYSFTWDNFRRAFQPLYLMILARSTWYALLSTIICVIVGYPVAFFIGRASLRWRNRLLMLVMIPFWTSFLIRTYAWINILGDHGLINSLLLSAGAIAMPLTILYTWKAVVIGLTYSYLPFMILPIYTSVEKLDQNLLDASADLGANPWRTFWRVILPLTLPGISAGVLLVFVPAIAMFAITDLMGGAKVPMIGNAIQTQFIGEANNWPFGAALGMVLMLMFGVVYWLSGFVKGQTVST
jgi:spermidine/putrescine transport system permease protein